MSTYKSTESPQFTVADFKDPTMFKVNSVLGMLWEKTVDAHRRLDAIKSLPSGTGTGTIITNRNNVTITGGGGSGGGPGTLDVWVVIPAAFTTASIQAAIDSLPSTGGVIQLEDGTYISNTDYVNIDKDNVTIQGNGSTSIISLTGDMANGYGLININASNVILQNFAVDGGREVPIRKKYGGSGSIGVLAGTCNTSGTSVSRVSGDSFDSDATKIRINWVDYAVASVTDGDNIVLETSAGTQTGVAFLAEGELFDNSPHDAALVLNSSFKIFPGESDILFYNIAVYNTYGYLCYGDCRTGDIRNVIFDSCYGHDNRPHTFGVGSGTVNTSGTTVTWASGDTFPSFISHIDINGTVYAVDVGNPSNSSTTLILESSAGSQSGVAHNLNIFGSWTGGIFFGGDCGSGNPYKASGIKVQNCRWYRCDGNCFWSHCLSFDVQHEDFTVNGCEFVDIGRDGTMIGNVSGCSVTNCKARNIGFITESDSDTPQPRYLADNYAVAYDNSGFVSNATISNCSAEEYYGGGIDLDGFRNGSVCWNSLKSTQAVAKGIQTGDTSANDGGHSVSIIGNFLDGNNVGAIVLNQADGCLCKNNIIIHPTGASVVPILLYSGNSGTKNTTVSGNTISWVDDWWAIAESGSVVQAGTCDTNGTAVTRVTGSAFDSTLKGIVINGVAYTISSVTDGDNLVLASSAGSQTGEAYVAQNGFTASEVNYISSNTLVGSKGEFLKHPSSGSLTGFSFSSNDATLSDLTKSFIQRESRGSGAALKVYDIDTGGAQKQYAQWQFDNGLLNVSIDGAALTGIITTGNRTTLGFSDAMWSGKLMGDGFFAAYDKDGAGGTYDDDDADLLTDDWALIRFNKTGGKLEQSLTTLAGARVWTDFGGGSGVSGLTAGRIPFAQSASVLIDDALLQWDNSNNIFIVDNGGTAFFGTSVAGSANFVVQVVGGLATWSSAADKAPLLAVGYLGQTEDIATFSVTIATIPYYNFVASVQSDGTYRTKGVPATSSTTYGYYGKKTVRFGQDAGDDSDAGAIEYRPSYASTYLSLIGAGTTAGARLIKLYDRVVVGGDSGESALTVDDGNIVLTTGYVTSAAGYQSANTLYNTVDIPAGGVNANTHTAKQGYYWAENVALPDAPDEGGSAIVMYNDKLWVSVNGAPYVDLLGSTGSISGTLTAGRIPFASGTTTISDNDYLQWNDASSLFVVKTGAKALFGLTASSSSNHLVQVFGNVISWASAANKVPLSLVGETGQTADLTEWANKSLTVIAGVDASGTFYSKGTKATSDTSSTYYGKQYIRFAQGSGEDSDAGVIAYKPSYAATYLALLGAGTTAGARLVKIYDRLVVSGSAGVSTITVDSGNVVLTSGYVNSSSGYQSSNSAYNTVDIPAGGVNALTHTATQGYYWVENVALPAEPSSGHSAIIMHNDKLWVSVNGAPYVDLLGSTGSISGTLTSGRIPFATASTTIDDDDLLQWDNSNKYHIVKSGGKSIVGYSTSFSSNHVFQVVGGIISWAVSATKVPISIVAYTGQTADLTEWASSALAIVAGVTAGGTFKTSCADATSPSTTYAYYGKQQMRFGQTAGDQWDSGSMRYRSSDDAYALAIYGAGTTDGGRIVSVRDVLKMTGYSSAAPLSTSGCSNIALNTGVSPTRLQISVSASGYYDFMLGEGLSTGYMPYASAANRLANSGCYWASATSRLGIGTSSPSYTLHVVGQGYFAGAGGAAGLTVAAGWVDSASGFYTAVVSQEAFKGTYGGACTRGYSIYTSAGGGAYTTVIDSSLAVTCSLLKMSTTTIINAFGQFVSPGGVAVTAASCVAAGFGFYSSGYYYWGQTSSFTEVTQLGWDGDTLKYKYRTITVSGGLITTIGTESGWTTVGAVS